MIETQAQRDKWERERAQSRSALRASLDKHFVKREKAPIQTKRAVSVKPPEEQTRASKPKSPALRKRELRSSQPSSSSQARSSHKYKDAERRKAYRREWMRKRREQRKAESDTWIRRQRGYTVLEAAIIVVIIATFIGYVIILTHFVAKYW
jgi:hypothetical protein